MKTAICILAIALLGITSPAYSQPPGYSSDSDSDSNSSGIKIALAWGEQLKPPSSYGRFLINLRDAMTKWGGPSTEILSQVRIGSSDLMKLTVLFINADEAFEISNTEKKNLQRFIAKGGLIVVDDAAANIPNSASAASLRKMIKEIAGAKRLETVPKGHEIYSVPFKFDGPPQGSDNAFSIVGMAFDRTGGRHTMVAEANNARDLQGVFIKGRLAILFCTKGYTPKWHAVSNNDPQLKFGVNLIAYGVANRK